MLEGSTSCSSSADLADSLAARLLESCLGVHSHVSQSYVHACGQTTCMWVDRLHACMWVDRLHVHALCMCMILRHLLADKHLVHPIIFISSFLTNSSYYKHACLQFVLGCFILIPFVKLVWPKACPLAGTEKFA